MAITNAPLDPWYDPNSRYGWTGNFYPDTPLADTDLNNYNREGAWGDFLQTNGFGGTGTTGEYGRSLWSRANQGYDAARTRNPILKWTDYLKTLNLDQIAASASPQARGENTQRYVGPLRYQMRSQ